MKLTLAKVAELARQDIRELKVLEASNKGISDTDDLSVCIELKKVNLSKNELKTLDGLTYCTGLTFLNISENQVETLSGLHKLGLLAVLNASKNSLSHIEGIARLSKLKALILNENKLKRIPHLAKLAELNTLVVSKNEIEDISPVRTLRSLTKLSASHNGIIVIPDLSDLHDLGELRLNDNKIMHIPDTIHLNFNLKILDLGNNRIAKLSDMEILAQMPNLKQLTLKGNPVAKEPRYKEKIAEMIPSLEVLDGERFRGKKLHRILYMKQKKAEAEGKTVEFAGKRKGKRDEQPASDQSDGTGQASADTKSAQTGGKEHTKSKGHGDRGDAQLGAPSAPAHPKHNKHQQHPKKPDANGQHGRHAAQKSQSGSTADASQRNPKHQKATQGNEPRISSESPQQALGNTIKPDKRIEKQNSSVKPQQSPKHSKPDSVGKKQHSKPDAVAKMQQSKPDGSQKRPPAEKGGDNETAKKAKTDPVDPKPQPVNKGKQQDDSGVVKVVTKKHAPKVEDVASLFAMVGEADSSVGVGGDSAWD